MTSTTLRTGRELAVVGIVGTLSLLGGLLSAAGRPAFVAIFIGLLVAALVVSSRVALFWFVVVVALVATGLAQLYLPGTGARYVRYVAPVASLGLLLHWVNDQLMAHPRNRTDLLPMPVVWGIAFALTGLVSVLVNLSTPDVAVMGARSYFQMGGFFLAVALLRWDHSTLDRSLVRAMIALALLQIPFAVHQYFALVPLRYGLGGGVVPVDIVAGTFGATLLGGGANAVLAAYQIIVVAVLVALWKNNAMSLLRMATLSLLLLTPLLVNQAKIAVLYLPLVFVVLFRRDFIVRPGKFVIAGIGAAGVFAVLMTALMLTHPSGKFSSWGDLVDFVVTRQTASVAERGHDQYSALTRWTSLTFWAEEHATANPVHTLVGHGLGASREQEDSGFAHTLAERRYPGLNIGHTAISALLWDTGVIGLATVLGMLASAFFMAGALARHHRGRDPFRCGLYEGLQAAVAVLALALAHKDFFVVHIPFQTITYLIVGFIANAWLEMVRSEGKRNARRWRL